MDSLVILLKADHLQTIFSLFIYKAFLELKGYVDIISYTHLFTAEIIKRVC